MTHNPPQGVIILSLLVLFLAGCQTEKLPHSGPTDRNLAEAQWSLTDRENREKQCGIYRTKGREGLAHALETHEEKFLDDFTDMLEKLCPPLAQRP